ncbi:3-hydroxy-lignoceroyl-CoA dehydratase [Fragilaria crotonensis]|nr:3-hydroxy-lignoceroyl-CoA dehydratase [Fragilaria crotonensis]
MEWPIKNDDGSFKTTPTAIEIWMESMKGVVSPEAEEWRSQIKKVKNWRNEYIDVVERQCAIMLKSHPDVAIQMAKDGLEALNSAMLFRIDDNTTVSAKEAFERSDIVQLETATVTTSKPEVAYQIPICSPKGTWLSGDKATTQLVAWSDYGCMEESASHHASAVCKLEDTSTLIKEKVFVLLGITSEMGCAKPILQIPGAQVLGVARKGERLDAFVNWYKEHGAGMTTLQYPKEGADMLLQGPEIAKWIVDTVPRGKEVIMCQLAYMDGEAHVRISVAMDLICQYVITHSPNKVSLSYLTSPATAHSITPDAAEDAKRRLDERPTWHSLTYMMSMGSWLKSNNSWEKDGLLNGLSHLQGPNYALAKTSQQWRCMVEYWNANRTVSCPHAPPTRTESMVRYATISAALEGMQVFEPQVSFSVESASSLLTAVMLYHICYDDSAANPKNMSLIEHPMHIFWDGSVHGGSWRCPYDSGSTGTLSFIFGKTMGGPYVPENSVADE